MHAQDTLRKEHMEGICMFDINGKVLRFLPGFCVIIFAYVVNVSFRVRDSRNEAQFAPSLHAPKKTISSHLNGRNILKTLLAQIKFKLLPQLRCVSCFRLANACMFPHQFSADLPCHWWEFEQRKWLQLQKLSTSWTMISFFTKTSTASIGSTYANPNQIAAAI